MSTSAKLMGTNTLLRSAMLSCESVFMEFIFMEISLQLHQAFIATHLSHIGSFHFKILLVLFLQQEIIFFQLDVCIESGPKVPASLQRSGFRVQGMQIADLCNPLQFAEICSNLLWLATIRSSCTASSI